MSHYNTLGLPEGANHTQISEAYSFLMGEFKDDPIASIEITNAYNELISNIAESAPQAAEQPLEPSLSSGPYQAYPSDPAPASDLDKWFDGIVSYNKNKRVAEEQNSKFAPAKYFAVFYAATLIVISIALLF